MKHKINFSFYCAGRMIFAFVQVCYLILLQLTVYRVTNHGFGLAALMLVRNVPLVFIGPFAGILVDRYKKRDIEVWFLSFMALSIWMLRWTTNLIQVYICAFLYMFFWTFVKPAFAVSISMLSDEEKLVEANSIVMIIEEIAGIAGAALISLFGDKGIPINYTLLFAAMLLSIVSFFLAHKGEEKKENVLQKREGFFSEFRSGWTYFKQEKGLYSLAIIVAMIWFAIGAFSSIQLIYIVNNLRLPDYYVGYISSVSSIGGILGVVLAPVLTQKFAVKKKKILGVGYLLSGTLISVLLLLQKLNVIRFIVIAITILLYSLTTYTSNTIEEVFEQELPAENHKGKVISFISTIGTIGYLISTTLAPVLTDYISVEYVMLISVVFFVLTFITIKTKFAVTIDD